MKKSSMIIGVLVMAVVGVILSYDYGWAQGRSAILPAKVGVVNVDQILKTSTRHMQWQGKMDLDRKRISAELEKLDKEAEAIKADMATHEKGSSGYMERMSSLMEKSSTIDAREKYYDQEVRMKVQNWTEKLYAEILAISSRVARAKGLDIVLAAQDVEFPTPGVVDLANMMRTNKVLYNAPDLDITAEVLAELDSAR